VTSAQERADAAAGEIAKAVAEMAGSRDGEMAIIVRSSMDGASADGDRVSGDLLWTWDWFWRPKTGRETTATPPG
jgi:hypothetical protein